MTLLTLSFMFIGCLEQQSNLEENNPASLELSMPDEPTPVVSHLVLTQADTFVHLQMDPDLQMLGAIAYPIDTTHIKALIKEGAPQPVIIIKATDYARKEDLVAMLDVIVYLGIEKYAIDKLQPHEESFLREQGFMPRQAD